MFGLIRLVLGLNFLVILKTMKWILELGRMKSMLLSSRTVCRHTDNVTRLLQSSFSVKTFVPDLHHCNDAISSSLL